MSRVLITGVGGFAGHHLANLCAGAGEVVIGSGRSEKTSAHVTTYISGDLTDRAQALGVVREAAPERVFHLAAEASVARSWRDPAGTIEANVSSTLHLLEALRLHAPAARVLVACSGEQYGPPERLPVDEQHRFLPQNPYAASKACVDTMAGAYTDSFALHAVRARAFNHAGPGQSDAYVVSSFARQIAQAEADGRSEVGIVTGNLEPRRDFTDVRDVVRAYQLALEHAEPGAYNVCSGRSLVIGDILAALARESPLDVRQRTDPSLLREHEVMEIRGSHDKLSAATGWQPEIPLGRTLRDTLDWWRERVRAEASR